MISGEAKTWQQLKVGSTVVLADLQTLAFDINGMSLEVTDVTRFEHETFGSWVLCETEGDLSVVARIISGEVFLYVVFKPDDFNPGTRQDLINNDCQWLFAEPNDTSNFIPADLEFSNSITFLNEDEMDVVYHAVMATTYMAASNSKVNQMFASVREWRSLDRDVENPYLVVFETGGLNGDGDPFPCGGYVQFFQGVRVTPGDIDVLPL